MMAPREPREPPKPSPESDRDGRQDDLSEGLGDDPRSPASEEERRRLLAQRERAAYRRVRRERGERRRPRRTKLRRPKLPRLRRPRLGRREREPAKAQAQGPEQAPATAEAPAPRRPRPSVADLRRASAGGLQATAERAGPAAGGMLRGAGRLLAWVAALILRLFALGERALGWVLGRLASLEGGAVGFLDRHATPERVLVAVTIAAAACLALAQFEPYRGVDVGRPDYADVSTVAPPPQTGVADAGSAHAYVLLPLAAVAAAIAMLALVRRRWRLARLIAAAGAIGIIVSLAIDLPKGLEAGTAGVAFAGSKATMKEGFYVQLAASATLVGCGLLLGPYLRSAERPARRRSSQRRPRARGGAPSIARGGA
jgi:hypothetical protein